jgi:hypothetical protein
MTEGDGEGDEPGSAGLLDADEIAFLLCVEANRLEPQARLLCESLRTFGGRYRDAPIYAVSPRPRLAPGRTARAHLDRLGVTQVVAPLNDTGSPYGTINLVLLDTDTLLAGEPRLVRADVGVRPVDVKGSASSGEGDPQDIYWARLCRFAGIALERLPWITTTIDHVRIRASYTGGFAVVRRDLGILAKTREIFLASLRADLRPLAGAGLDVLASTGAAVDRRVARGRVSRRSSARGPVPAQRGPSRPGRRPPHRSIGGRRAAPRPATRPGGQCRRAG